MNFLKEIKNLPERKRKIIFWILMVIMTLIVGFFYSKNWQKKLKSLEIDKLRDEIPELKIELPEFKIPEIPEEQLKQFREIMEEVEEGE